MSGRATAANRRDARTIFLGFEPMSDNDEAAKEFDKLLKNVTDQREVLIAGMATIRASIGAGQFGGGLRP
jgi:hypothetical protein